MKILFIEPAVIINREDLENLKVKLLDALFKMRKRFLANNLTIPTLAAITPEKHSIKFFDDRLEKINYEEDCDIVAITSTTYFSPRAYEIADKFRNRGKIVILGGAHPSGLPNEAKKHADSIVIGEAEGIWPTVLEDAENKRLKPFYKQKEFFDLKKLPQPNRDIEKKRLPIARIQATRGCPHGCEFCSIPNIQGNKLRKRPIEDVIKEIKSIPQKFIIFSDASLTIDTEYTKDLFKNMIGLKKKFSCCGNVDTLAKDEDLIKLSKKAGCVAWYIGFESFSQEVLDKMGKKTNKISEYKSAVDNIHKNKIAVVGSFICGFDEDTKESIRYMLKLINNLKIEVVESNILTPFPGTPLFERMDKDNRIFSRNWIEYYEGVVVFKPKNMTPEELDAEFYKLFWNIIPLKYSFKRYVRSTKLGLYPFIWTVLQNSSWV